MEQNTQSNNTIASIQMRLEALETENEKLKKKVNMLIIDKFTQEIVEVIKTSNLIRLKQIIEENEYPINDYFAYSSQYANTNILLYSVEQDKAEIVKYLCSLPSLNINVLEKGEHWNALMYAVENQSLTISSYLFEKNIDININDIDGFTPLSIAIDTQNENMVRMILEQKPKEERIDNVKSLIEPIENEVIKKLIIDYFNIKIEDEDDKDDE